MADDKAALAKEHALARFNEPGPAHINCAQTVLAYALEVLDKDPELIKVADYFGGGIAGKGEACGAITGAALALGVRNYYAETPDLQKIIEGKQTLQQAMDEFAEEFGACTCEELTGHDLSTPEGLAAFQASEARQNCTSYVEFMIDAIAGQL